MNILLVLAVIVAILLIIPLFIKKKYVIERETLINKPKQEIFSYIKLLKNQDHYNKWVMADPDLKKEYKGTDGTIGFVYAWEGNKQVGKGEQELKRIIEGDRIDIELRFKKPFEGIAQAYMATETVSEDQTKVRWVMEGSNPYPRNLMNLFMDSMLGKDLEGSLAKLKSALEKEPVATI